jgi:hypothetical protein
LEKRFWCPSEIRSCALFSSLALKQFRMAAFVGTRTANIAGSIASCLMMTSLAQS